MEYIKHIFYNNKVLIIWDITDEKVMKQWVIIGNNYKDYDKDMDLIEKAKSGLNVIFNNEKLNESDYKAFIDLIKKYKIIKIILKLYRLNQEDVSIINLFF
jgi:hypothetical protein